MKKILIVALAMLAACATAPSDAPADTVEAFLAALNEGDPAIAELFTARCDGVHR